jgi:hypothetical protein
LSESSKSFLLIFFLTFYNINKTYAGRQKFCVPSCTFRVGNKNGKKIISKLHAVDRIFGFTYIKFLSIFALFEDSDELADIYILKNKTDRYKIWKLKWFAQCFHSSKFSLTSFPSLSLFFPFFLLYSFLFLALVYFYIYKTKLTAKDMWK